MRRFLTSQRREEGARWPVWPASASAELSRCILLASFRPPLQRDSRFPPEPRPSTASTVRARRCRTTGSLRTASHHEIRIPAHVSSTRGSSPMNGDGSPLLSVGRWTRTYRGCRPGLLPLPEEGDRGLLSAARRPPRDQEGLLDRPVR